MIIQINATVCAAEDHGEESQHKFAGSGHHRRPRNGKGGPVTRRNKKFKERGRNAGSSCGEWPRTLRRRHLDR
jgi:hypothetical protein